MGFLRNNIMKYCFLFLILAVGCRVGPSYDPPCVVAPTEWKAEENFVQPPDVEDWWDIFYDPVLDCLEETALSNSPNLYIALQRIVESRAVLGVAKSELYPEVDLAPSYSDSGYLFKLLGLTTLPVPVTEKINPIVRVHQVQYTLPLNMSYELDLWGKIRSEVDAARFSLQAEEEDFDNTRLTLTTEVASNYFLMRSLDAEIAFLSETLKVQQNSYDLNRSRYEKGLVSFLDVAEAQATLAQTEANLDDTIRQRTLQENAIAALLGLNASSFHLDSNPLLSPPPAIPVGLPSTVLLRRPDLRKLEREAAADHSLINIVYASFFPSFDLTGTLGFLSPDFRDFLSWKSRLWSMGTNAMQIVFDGGRRRSELALAYANFRTAEASYQQGVVTAFQEVEDSLNNLEWQSRQVSSLKTAFEANNKSLQLSRNRYKEGLVNYLEVDTNQRNALQAESAYANALGQYYLSTVSLIKAIGGSWDCE